jgi:hypothetical protein
MGAFCIDKHPIKFVNGLIFESISSYYFNMLVKTVLFYQIFHYISPIYIDLNPSNPNIRIVIGYKH